MSRKNRLHRQIDLHKIRFCKLLEKMMARDPRYLAYLANAGLTTAWVVLVLEGKHAFPERRPAVVAEDLWNHLWLTGMMPIVLVDHTLQGLLKFFDGKSPFIAQITDLLDRDWFRTYDPQEHTWRVRPITMAFIDLLLIIFPLLAVEGIAAFGSVLQGIGEITPG